MVVGITVIDPSGLVISTRLVSLIPSRVLPKWAELEGKQQVNDNTVGNVFQKYINWADQRDRSKLSLRTIKDYRSFWKFLEPVFKNVDINDMKPSYLLRYFDARSSQIRGLKEIKFLSILFNWARLRGLMTAPNPVTGITRQLNAPSRRDIYVTDQDFELVYRNASQAVQDTISIALLTGQRPADVFKMTWQDIKDGVLTITQNKTGNVVRIAVDGQLKEVLSEIRSRSVVSRYLIAGGKGRPLSETTFKREFTLARDEAEAEAKDKGIQFTRWQLKDLRAKAATDSSSQTDAQKLLGHKNQATTVIYRRDRSEVIEPLVAKSLFAIRKASGEKLKTPD